MGGRGDCLSSTQVTPLLLAALVLINGTASGAGGWASGAYLQTLMQGGC